MGGIVKVKFIWKYMLKRRMYVSQYMTCKSIMWKLIGVYFPLIMDMSELAVWISLQIVWWLTNRLASLLESVKQRLCARPVLCVIQWHEYESLDYGRQRLDVKNRQFGCPISWQICIQIYFSTFNFGKSKLHTSSTRVISNPSVNIKVPSKHSQLVLSDTLQPNSHRCYYE